MDGKNILLSNHQFPWFSRLKIYAKNIPKICPKNPWNLPRTCSKSVWNVLEICPECLGDGQEVPKSPMESPAIWVSFLRVPKSLKRGDDGHAGFFGGDGSPCNIDKNSNHKNQPFEMLHFLFFWHGNFVCCNLLVENTIFKSLETQIKTHVLSYNFYNRFRFNAIQK